MPYYYEFVHRRKKTIIRLFAISVIVGMCVEAYFYYVKVITVRELRMDFSMCTSFPNDFGKIF